MSELIGIKPFRHIINSLIVAIQSIFGIKLVQAVHGLQDKC